MSRLTRSNSYWKKHEGGQMKAVITLSPRGYGAILFDLDGVLEKLLSLDLA